MTSVVDILIRTTDETSGANQGIIGSFTELNSIVGLAKQGMQALNDVYQQTVGKFEDYAGSVQQLHDLTGGTIQDTSRLITLFQDYGGTVNDLVMANRTLAKEGQSLTVDTLAKMSDEYNSLGTAAEKTDFLTKNFGRSSADLAVIMSQGSAAILAQSAAVSSSLVLTQKAIDEAQAYKLATAQLSDQWSGLTMELGEEAIPTLLKVVTTMDQLAQISQDITQHSAAGGGVKGWEALLPGAQEAAGVQEDHRLCAAPDWSRSGQPDSHRLRRGQHRPDEGGDG